jgi:hypothetical protein
MPTYSNSDLKYFLRLKSENVKIKKKTVWKIESEGKQNKYLHVPASSFSLHVPTSSSFSLFSSIS